MKEKIEKLQNLPEQQKKIILFSILGVLGLILLVIWVLIARNRIPAIRDALANEGLFPGMPQQEQLPAVSEEGKNWQTFSSTAYDFQISYPKNWYINAQIPADVYISPVSPAEGEMPFASSSLQIIVESVPAGISLDELVKNIYKKLDVSYVQEPVTIGGAAGLQVKTVCEGVGCGAPEWYTLNNNTLFHFYSGLGYQSTFDEIVSTFKFSK